MNLMEIDKNSEAIEKKMNLPDTIDKWKSLAQDQAKTLDIVTTEKNELQVKYQQLSEFILEFQERTHNLKIEKQKLFFENHELQEEIRKLNVEIQCQTIELSETQKLNQSLQQSNDDLRNRNGLKSRSEQEQLEEEIKDVRDQNSKLQIQVNKSSVEAVDEAQKKQKEAEKKMEQAEEKARNEKKRAELEIRKARKKAKREIDDMKKNMYVWSWGYIMIIVCSLVQNGAFQRDILQLGKKPIEWWLEYAEWFENLEYLGYSAGEVCFERILTMMLIMLGVIGSILIIWGGMERYKKIWDSVYKTVLILSVSFIAVLGNMIREFIPINLLVIVCFINIGTVWIRKYLESKYS